MIITCPDCATRYDVDDERFSPNGRSVRCSACGESWFVPAPELIDVEPLEEKPSPRRKAYEEDGDEDDDFGPRIKVGFAESDDDARGPVRKRARDFGSQADKGGEIRKGGRRAETYSGDYDDDYEDDLDEDDSLFDAPPQDSNPKGGAPAREEAPEKGWRKGRQFIVEDEDDAIERRPYFARKRREPEKEPRESLRFADDEDDRRSADYAGDRFDDEDPRSDAEWTHRGRDERDAYNSAYVVDADWEDVEDGQAGRGRGFGRRIRAERRRATALARMEDVRPLDPAALDDEFFASLRVTPRELERAIRKARRRAESREKNRLTPLRVIGWTAWLAVVATAGYALFIYRDEIVKAAPKAADAYAVIGIEANPYGLAIEDVRHRLAMSTGGPTIEITGHLRNETRAAVTAPLLQAEALGPRGELLARWTFTAAETQVPDGASV